MLLALLVSNYKTGMFSSRPIKHATSENVAVRLRCADPHPDHDTPCTFRRKNGPLLTQAFKQILERSARCGVRPVGQITPAIDGSKILANANKPSAVSHRHAKKPSAPSTKRPPGCWPKPNKPARRRCKTA